MMKKKLIIIVLLFLLMGCGSDSQSQISKLKGTIKSAEGESILIQYNKMEMSIFTGEPVKVIDKDEKTIEITQEDVGREVIVYYDGGIHETGPLTLGGVYKVELLEKSR